MELTIYLDKEYHELLNIDPNPENHYTNMASILNLDLYLIQKIWNYQLEFLNTKVLVVKCPD